VFATADDVKCHDNTFSQTVYTDRGLQLFGDTRKVLKNDVPVIFTQLRLKYLRLEATL